MNKKSYKKYFNATLAATVATTGAAVVAPNTADASTNFSDVPTTNNFYNEVTNLSERGIIKGFEDGTFRPGDNVTRGQAAKIIAGALGLDTKNVKDPGFTDIPTTHQYYGAIAALANAGIISGYEDDTYRAGEPVQRNHMAKIIAGAFNLQATSGYTTPLTDVRNDYKNYISALHEYGVTTGKTTTTFDGSSNVTRGQLAAFVVRAEKAVAEVGNEETFTISEVAGTSISGNDATYEVATNLQGIFSKANEEVLKGAVLKAKVVENEIVSVLGLELNVGGQEGSLATFNGSDATIDGNLVVNADYIEVTNVTVKGNVTLTDQVVSEFGADGLNTEGELIIDEAEVKPVAVASLTPIAADLNKGPKVTLKNTKVGKVNTKRDNVSLSSDSKLPEIVVSAKVSTIQVDADVTKVTIDVDVKITVTGNANIDEVAVEKASEVALEVAGAVAKLAVNNTTTKVLLAANVKVESLVVPKGTEAKDVISNYDEVKGNISQVEESDDIAVEEPNNNTGNSGSGGGGGSSRDDDDNDNRDRIAPTLKLWTNVVGVGQKVDIQSNETGAVYLVPITFNPTSVSELDQYVRENSAVKLKVDEANRDYNIPTSTLSSGEYNVYAVDNTGNISAPKKITILTKVNSDIETLNPLELTATIDNSSVPENAEKVVMLADTYLFAITHFIDYQLDFNIENAVSLNNEGPTDVALHVENGGTYNVALLFLDENNKVVGYDLQSKLVNGLTGETAPTLIVHDTYVKEGDYVELQSSEQGAVYLVESSLNPTTVTELENYATTNNTLKLTVYTANSNFAFTTTGLERGTYNIYAVDQSGNISEPKKVSIIENVETGVTFEDSDGPNLNGTKLVAKVLNENLPEGTSKIALINRLATDDSYPFDLNEIDNVITQSVKDNAQTIFTSAETSISIDTGKTGEHYALLVFLNEAGEVIGYHKPTDAITLNEKLGITTDQLGLTATSATSSTPDVATVTIRNDGGLMITGIAQGNTYITALDENGNIATFWVMVSETAEGRYYTSAESFTSIKNSNEDLVLTMGPIYGVTVSTVDSINLVFEDDSALDFTPADDNISISNDSNSGMVKITIVNAKTELPGNTPSTLSLEDLIVKFRYSSSDDIVTVDFFNNFSF